MGYREESAPSSLHDLVEKAWTSEGAGEEVRVLPDGCMDLIRMNGTVVVAGPDTTVTISSAGPEPVAGLRFRPGVLPRLLGVPAERLRNQRVPLRELTRTAEDSPLRAVAVDLASRPTRSQTSPWPLSALHHVTARLARGDSVGAVADDVGWSNRTLQRQSLAVYGYGPATLRRILRFRHALRLLGSGIPAADVAAGAGYSDQSHLHRDVKEFSGLTLGTLAYRSGANRSTDVPPGSATVQ